MAINLKSKFAKNIIAMHGEEGRWWLKCLPSIVASYKEIFGLSDIKQVTNLSYNYIVSCSYAGRDTILKIGFEEDAFWKERDALDAFRGFGSVEYLGGGGEVMLLDRIIPGYSLKSYFPDKENESLAIACKVIKRLNEAPITMRVTGCKFPHL